MGTTNYVDTFILASADSKARAGVAPARPGTVAALQYGLLRDAPYRYTSDELLFEVHASRQGIDQAGRKAAWDAFFARSQACLRAAPLVKQFGWGLHHDGQGKVALVGGGNGRLPPAGGRPGIEGGAGHAQQPGRIGAFLPSWIAGRDQRR